MKVLQLTGHYHKWNLDSHFQNSIGDGFIFSAYSIPFGFFDAAKINTYNTKEILPHAFLDLQYFGKRDAGKITKGKLKTYPFHPANNADSKEHTNTLIEGLIKKGIQYQIEELGLTNVIIPNIYDNENTSSFIAIVKGVNKWLSKNKKTGIKYFMTIPIPHHTIIDEDKVDKMLYHLTDQEIVFDGYYIVCEAKPDGIQKLNIDFKYLNNLATVLSVLKKQKFSTIYSYANWDALIFLALTDIDYITIGTYENLRNFSIKRFTVEEDGGPSKGWYFSEKLLNMVKSPLLDLVRLNKGLDLIKNDRNIFSDSILVKDFPWSNQKPEVHKNYLLSMERLLRELSEEKDLNVRKDIMLKKIESAMNVYNELDKKGIYFTSESKNYHLDTWYSFLRSRKPFF